MFVLDKAGVCDKRDEGPDEGEVGEVPHFEAGPIRISKRTTESCMENQVAAPKSLQTDRDGHTVRLIEVFRAICLRCGEPISAERKFYALDAPYNGVLHEECAPLYNYPGKWPHPGPAKLYEG